MNTLTTEKTLKKVHTILKRMWMHDNDGSDFFPVPEKFWTSENYFDWSKLTERRKQLKERDIDKLTVNEHLLFDIMFNEVLPLLEKAIGE